MELFDKIQNILNFDGCRNQNYLTSKGIGKIGLIGYLLGWINGISIGILIMSNPINNNQKNSALIPWCLYLSSLTLFHFLEFFVTSLYQPNTLSYDSYVVNHSKSYTMAAIASWVEYWIEFLLFGEIKLSFRLPFFYLGIVSVLVGQSIRSLAMIQCGENFSHQIVDKKEASHQLVTKEIYNYLRHPSYFGWFYWSIGTQLILLNPICFLGYFYVSWKFFQERILYEEYLLQKFFGEDYIRYKKRTIVGIPFIS